VIVQRASHRAGVPWRNGLGVQYEIAAETGWRLSTADLTTDVQFSVFAGVTREFCVAQGGGVILTIDGETHRCELESITVFDGAADVYCALPNGSAKALNLMVPHGEAPVHLSVFRLGEVIEQHDAIVAIGGPALLRNESGDGVELDVLDAVLSASEVFTVAQGVVAAIAAARMNAA